MITTFRIHPEIESYIRKQSEEENRLLEEAILAEDCRDPLVVWEEQNVLVDGHHRIAICRKHGLSYSVVYRSFPDIEAVKRWMRLNQLSRRNLDKEERERWIKELHAEGWTQAEIGEAVGANQSTVSRVLMQTHKPQISQTDDSTTTQRLKDELASMQPVVRKRTPRFKASSMFHVKHELLTFPRMRR